MIFRGVLFVLLFSAAAHCFAGEKVPEKLLFTLSWAGVPVGFATQDIFDDSCFRRISSTARSNDWLSRIFPVDYRTESLLEKAGDFPGVPYISSQKKNQHALTIFRTKKRI